MQGAVADDASQHRVFECKVRQELHSPLALALIAPLHQRWLDLLQLQQQPLLCWPWLSSEPWPAC